MSILICGGAGYIGSHINKLLSNKGYDTIVYDNLIYGHREAVKWGRFIEADLAEAHLLALEYLDKGGESGFFNLGNENGTSVLEVIESVKKVTGKEFKVTLTDRRPGDPPVLVGSAERAKNILGWKPRFSDIDVIVEHAVNWYVGLNGLER